MYRYEPKFDCHGVPDTSVGEFVYGAQWRDQCFLREPTYLPRFAHLARKVLMHYAGDYYNPHTIDLFDEYTVRCHICYFIEYKIKYKTSDYDWEFIDHYFRKIVGGIYDLDLKPDTKRLKQGLKAPYKGKLHEVADTLPN